ncbi:peptidase family S49-domain-containing protein [Scenedesmus sp. NREL 46B-D3]|nr:peptidase family S49-domain-containing protein [Scenedesmus sp. NREL 46B-D3]
MMLTSGLSRCGVPAKPCTAQRALPQLAAPSCRLTSSSLLPQQRFITCLASNSEGDASVLEQAASAVTPTTADSSSPGSAATTIRAAAAEISSSPSNTPEPDNNNNKDDKDAPKHRDWVPDASSLTPLQFQPLSDSERGWANFKLLFALPWRRFKRDAVLTFKLEGEISDQLQGRFSPGFSIPQLTDALEKAAVDPRVKGIAVEINPLAIGWAKVQELRRYIKLFRDSGKFTIAYMKTAGEKEYYLASAFQELVIAPTANLRLAGFSVAGTFLRGVLDKVGVEPQVQRIGAYKSAGDQLLRRDMSEAQREQLGELLDDIYEHFLDTVAEARGKTREEVAGLLDRGVYDNEVLLAEGWVDSLKYEDEVIADLKKRTGGKEDEVAKVGLSRYSKVSRSAFGLNGKKRIAVLRAGGAILGKASGVGSGSITPEAIIPKLRALAKDKKIAGVVLRVDSPGGDALASDLMWREIQQLAEKKPCGGYYMSMAAQAIVAQPLTVTGSIGVVTGKFNLAELYERVGYAKTLLSRGKFAEFLAADNRAFNDEEASLFEESAQYAYRSFRDKAAASRKMPVEEMQAVAQGRVWTGQRALQRQLVDVLGGLHEAVALVKQAAGIDQGEKVTLLEVSRTRTSPLKLLGGGTSVLAGLAALGTLSQGGTPSAAFSQALGAAVLQQAAGSLLPGMLPNGLSAAAGLQLLQQVSAGQPLCYMTDVDASSLVSAGGVAAGAGAAAFNGGVSSGVGGLFDDDEAAVQAFFTQLEDAVEQLL